MRAVFYSPANAGLRFITADAGLGLVAGLGIALIAIIADRIIQAWSAGRKAALGIA